MLIRSDLVKGICRIFLESQKHNMTSIEAEETRKIIFEHVLEKKKEIAHVIVQESKR
ncbi:MAG TPA: hypothetical protein VK431_04140 [Nitrosopumilaceae archaeon]|nr:hypothetical protein [Nitrosopumilaceae archaeon]